MNNKILSIGSFILVFALGIYGFATYKKYRTPPNILFKDLELINDKNEFIRFKPKSNKISVLIFSASWCSDCKIEFTKILKERNPKFENFDFNAITDEGFALMDQYKKKTNYPFTFYSLKKPFDEYSIYAIPTIYFLNEKNEVLFEKVGGIQWDDKDFIDKLANSIITE